MSKCKRNLLLIFGYLLILALLFVPFAKEIYILTPFGEFPKGFPNIAPYDPDSNDSWERLPSVEVIGHKKITKKSINKNGVKFLPLYLINVINHKNFINWKKQEEEKPFNYLDKEKKIINKEELFRVQNEFIKKYNGEFRYDKLRIDFFLTELAIIILAGGFAYIFFCVVLRKAEKKREKRRKGIPFFKRVSFNMKQGPSRIEYFIAKFIRLEWSKVLLLIVFIYFLIAFIFALLYLWLDLVLGASGLLSNFYFSIVTQTALGYTDFKPKQNFLAQTIVIIHTSFGLFYFVLSSAVIVFKILRAPRKIFVFDENAIFYPKEETLRFRIYGRSNFPITNVKYTCYIRRWIDREVPHPHYGLSNIKMYQETIPIMKPMDPFIVKTIPGGGEEITFLPNIINIRDEIILYFNGDILDLKDKVHDIHTYKIKDIKCGKLKLIDPYGLGPEKWEEYDWKNWNKWEPISSSHCKACKYSNDCNITVKSTRERSITD